MESSRYKNNGYLMVRKKIENSKGEIKGARCCGFLICDRKGIRKAERGVKKGRIYFLWVHSRDRFQCAS